MSRDRSLYLSQDPVSTPHHAELSRVIERFPEHALGVRESFLRDERFRSVCTDYCLACDSLARFEALSDARHRDVIAEYRSLMGDLEIELAERLPGARQDLETRHT
jgi:hypothetical protein